MGEDGMRDEAEREEEVREAGNSTIYAAKRFVLLGDDPGIFMTCESGTEGKPCVRLSCQSLQHAHLVHGAIIDIVKSVRPLLETP